METLYVVVGWLSIPVTLLSVIWMVVTWRRQRNLTAASLWFPILASGLSLFLYVRLIGLEVRPVVTWLPFFGAGVLGVVLGRAGRVEADDDRVVATRNPWTFLVWAASFAATQLVALLAPESAETMLGLLFAATGLTIGEQLALISARSTELGKIRSAMAAAAALVLIVALGAALAPRQAHAADEVDLQDVAELEVENGDVYEGRSGVAVDVKGVDGVYSGSSIDLTITNDTDETLRVRVPVGTRLYPDDDGVQTMLTAGNELIEVPPGQTVTKRIQAYCGEASDGAPSSGDDFTVGEITTNQPLLDSLREMSNRFNNPDPERPNDPSRNQRDGVWSHTDPQKHPPPLEDEEGYDLFKPEPDGPTEEESGTGGGAVALSNGGIAAVATKPTRRGGKGTKSGGKPGPKVDTEPSDDDQLYIDQKQTEQTEQTGDSDDDFEQLLELEEDDEAPTTGDEPAEQRPTKPTKQPPATPPDRRPGEQPGQQSEPPGQQTTGPTYQLGPISYTPGTDQYSADLGGGANLGVNPTEQQLTYRDKSVDLFFDRDDNIGRLKSRHLTLNTRPNSFDGVHTGRSGTRTFQGGRQGDTKSGSLKIEPAGGGRTTTYTAESGPNGVTVSQQRGQRTTKLHIGDNWEASFKNPSVQWQLGKDSNGPKVSYQNWSNLDAGRIGDFQWLKGIQHERGETGLTYGLKKPVTHHGNELLSIGFTGTTRGGGTTTFVSFPVR